MIPSKAKLVGISVFFIKNIVGTHVIKHCFKVIVNDVQIIIRAQTNSWPIIDNDGSRLRDMCTVDQYHCRFVTLSGKDYSKNYSTSVSIQWIQNISLIVRLQLVCFFQIPYCFLLTKSIRVSEFCRYNLACLCCPQRE